MQEEGRKSSLRRASVGLKQEDRWRGRIQEIITSELFPRREEKLSLQTASRLNLGQHR